MPARPSDSGIPTLTQRAEPTLHVPSAVDEPDAPLLTERADDDDFPLLTDVADSLAEDWNVDEAPAVHAAARPVPAESSPDAAPFTTIPTLAAASAPPPDASVLTARLQAEVEHLMRQALTDAIQQMQARMDAELPDIVRRVLSEVKRG